MVPDPHWTSLRVRLTTARDMLPNASHKTAPCVRAPGCSLERAGNVSFQHLSAHFSVLFPSSWQRKFEKLVCLLILVIAAELSHNLSQFD